MTTDPKKRFLNTILRKDVTSNPELASASVMTKDGIMLSAVTEHGINHDRLGAMGSSILSLANRVSHELKKGNVKQNIINSEDGLIIITGISAHAVLVVTCLDASKLGKVINLSNSLVRKIISSNKTLEIIPVGNDDSVAA